MCKHDGDLISRSALLNMADAEIIFGTTATRMIKTAPAVDAVEVVRCKDCKHYAEAKGIDSGKPCGYGKCCCAVGIRGVVYDDDFCSCGERRDGE